LRTIATAAAAFLSMQAADCAVAQVYPSRPVTIVVPFAAGGPTDTLARIVADRMKDSLGQPVVVENVPGAAGSVGVGRIARAAPDGHTIGIGQWDTHVLNGAIQSLSYDLVADFEPIALLPSNPQVIVAKKAMPADDLAGLIAWLRANPDKASQGTAGAGSAAHVSGAYFQKVTGTRFQFVPYRGAAPAIRDLVAGQIDLMFDQASNALPHVRGGTIRPYAVTAKSRLPSAPDIPTVDEAGLPGFHISIWRGFWAPKGTPREVVARLNAAVADALADGNVKQRVADLGQDLPPPDQRDPSALGVLQKSEIEKWWPIIKVAGIKAE
jgi:tripartite-type tricarboxylate transporter receptor subunit TctC